MVSRIPLEQLTKHSSQLRLARASDFVVPLKALPDTRGASGLVLMPSALDDVLETILVLGCTSLEIYERFYIEAR